MSGTARHVVQIIFLVAFNGPLSVLGIGLGVINIIIFIKQGFNDAVNISLFGLAMSDMGSLLALAWTSTSYNPLFQHLNINFEAVPSGLIHGLCVRITSWITAFITFERCLCIALPMKVKVIITPKRTFFIVFAIFAVLLVGSAPAICPVFMQFVPSFNFPRNITTYELYHSWNGGILEHVALYTNAVEHLVSFICVIVFTLVLLYNLRVKSQWRYRATISHVTLKSFTVPARDKRVMKMVTLLSVIFIVCFAPGAVNIILNAHMSEYSAHGVYQDSYHITWAIFNFLEVINNSVGIIVFYNMSSKYRTSFNELFSRC